MTALDTILERARARAAELDLGARLEARAVDRELQGVLRAFAAEIEREAIDARRALLLALAAEVLVLDRPAVELARVERILRALDPEDVRELRIIAQTEATPLARRCGGGPQELTDGRARRQRFDLSPSREVIQCAGLMQVDDRYSPPEPLFISPRVAAIVELARAWS